MNPRVVWVSFAPLEKGPLGLTSSWASARYRLTIPAAALERHGWPSRATYIAPHANRRTLVERFSGADVGVLGKVIPESTAVGMQVLDVLRSNGVRIVADFCDDNFADPQLGPVYGAFANVADVVVASTPGIAEMLRRETATPIVLVTDPVEGERSVPVVRNIVQHPGKEKGALKVLWYGRASNMNTLQFGMPALVSFAKRCAIVLTIVSAGDGAKQATREIAESWMPAGSSSRFVQWTTQSVFSELQVTDVVVIPSNPHEPRRVVKSPNRFTEALWAGRFVVAHPLPAYEELSEYGWVGENLEEGLRWYVEHPDEAKQRILLGQAAIAERFTPAAVAQSWKTAISRALERV